MGLYDYLMKIHKANFPDWRFFQFIMNFISWYGADPFYLEDEKIYEKIVSDIYFYAQLCVHVYNLNLQRPVLSVNRKHSGQYKARRHQIVCGPA